MLRNSFSAKFGRVAAFAFLACVALSLTGCLSHWFLESDSRLQVENRTENWSIISVDVASENRAKFSSWIDETLLPGERSHVVEEDWVGDFTFRVKYTKSSDATGDTLVDYHEFNLDGGSLYLIVEEGKGKLSYRFK